MGNLSGFKWKRIEKKKWDVDVILKGLAAAEDRGKKQGEDGQNASPMEFNFIPHYVRSVHCINCIPVIKNVWLSLTSYSSYTR